MTIWSPDTCDCVVEYNKKINWISTIRKCRLHQSLDRQDLLNAVLTQNRRFNLAHGINPTPTEIEDLILSKDINKQRIRKENLDNFHEHLPEHHTRSFFENLRRILRI